MAVENAPGWNELSDHDKVELKKFEDFLKNREGTQPCRCCGTKPAGVGDVCRFCYMRGDDLRPSVWTMLGGETPGVE